MGRGSGGSDGGGRRTWWRRWRKRRRRRLIGVSGGRVTLTSTVAQNTSLYLEGLGGATITWCLGSTYTRSADGSVELGDLYAEDEKDLLVEVRLPVLAASVHQPVAVPRGRLRAFNVGQLAMETREATVVVTRPPLTPINQPQTNAKRMPNECQTNAKRMPNECQTNAFNSQ
jgi:hypothetical protein